MYSHCIHVNVPNVYFSVVTVTQSVVCCCCTTSCGLDLIPVSGKNNVVFVRPLYSPIENNGKPTGDLSDCNVSFFSRFEPA